jgi:hypothetical protein
MGEIRVGGVALRGAAVPAWRNCVGYVSQDPFLFHDTIRHNFLWANPEADEELVWDVLRLTGAEELVRSAPQGLDTVVGERGGLLSGGEGSVYASPGRCCGDRVCWCSMKRPAPSISTGKQFCCGGSWRLRRVRPL